jgi:hypothetical protein
MQSCLTRACGLRWAAGHQHDTGVVRVVARQGDALGDGCRRRRVPAAQRCSPPSATVSLMHRCIMPCLRLASAHHACVDFCNLLSLTPQNTHSQYGAAADEGLLVRNSINYKPDSGEFFYYDDWVGEVMSKPEYCCNKWHYVGVSIEEDGAAKLMVDGGSPRLAVRTRRYTSPGPPRQKTLRDHLSRMRRQHTAPLGCVFRASDPWVRRLNCHGKGPVPTVVAGALLQRCAWAGLHPALAACSLP